jgi:hypothetical protein
MNAEERLRKLNSTAIEHMKVLINNKSLGGLRGDGAQAFVFVGISEDTKEANTSL